MQSNGSNGVKAGINAIFGFMSLFLFRPIQIVANHRTHIFDGRLRENYVNEINRDEYLGSMGALHF